VNWLTIEGSFFPDWRGRRSAHDELYVIGLDLSPGLDHGFGSILGVMLEVFPRQLAGQQ
jgi:hypothetical protein